MPRSRQVQGELPAPRGNETQTSHGRVVSVTFDRKKEGRDEAGKKQTVLTKIRSEVAVGMERPSIEAPKDQKLPPYPHQKACQSCVAGWTPRRGAPVRHRPETPVGNVSCQEAFALTPLFHLFNFIARRSGILSCRPWAWNLLGHRTLLVFSFISNKHHTRQTANAAQQATNDPSLASSRRRPPQVILLPPSAPSSLAVASRPASRARRLKSPCRGLV